MLELCHGLRRLHRSQVGVARGHPRHDAAEHGPRVLELADPRLHLGQTGREGAAGIVKHLEASGDRQPCIASIVERLVVWTCAALLPCALTLSGRAGGHVGWLVLALVYASAILVPLPLSMYWHGADLFLVAMVVRRYPLCTSAGPLTHRCSRVYD